jgi:hypothetical protein
MLREDRPRDRDRPRARHTARSRDRSVSPAGFAVSPDFEPFQGTVAPCTAGGVVLAGVAFAVLRRRVGHAVRAYVRLAIVALVLSWIPDVALLVIHDPGATVPAVASLMVMHAVTAAIVVTLLVRIAHPS